MGLKKTMEDQFGYSSEKYIKIASAVVDMKNKTGVINVEVWHSRAASKNVTKLPLIKTAICLCAQAEQQAGADTKAAWEELTAVTVSAAYNLIKTKKLVITSTDTLDLTNASDVIET